MPRGGDLVRFLQPPTARERAVLGQVDAVAAPVAERHREPGIYILRRKSDGTPLYVGTAGDLSRRLRSHARESSLLAHSGIPWSEIDGQTLSLPHANPALLSVLEIALIAGIGRAAEGARPLLNRDGGGGEGHALAPAELTARALEAERTWKLSARARKAHATRRRNASAAIQSQPKD